MAVPMKQPAGTAPVRDPAPSDQRLGGSVVHAVLRPSIGLVSNPQTVGASLETWRTAGT